MALYDISDISDWERGDSWSQDCINFTYITMCSYAHSEVTGHMNNDTSDTSSTCSYSGWNDVGEAIDDELTASSGLIRTGEGGALITPHPTLIYIGNPCG